MRKVDRTKEPSLCLQGSDTTTYTYDAQGNLTRSVLEYYGYEQARSDHTYNNFDRLTEVRDNYGITEYTYDADGRRTSKTRNGVTEQYIWDGDQLVVKLGTERITQFTLSTSKGADVRMPKLVEGQTYGLTVNGASYTAKAKKTVGEDDGPIQITRARPDDTEIPVLPPVTGKTRILLEFGPVSMEMEVNENPTTDGLVNVYVIGPANTAIALYDGDPALGTATYIRGLSLVAAVRDGVRTYYHYNAHGDVVQLTNSSGTVTKNYTYDAFGVEQDASDSDANPFRYCGEQYDSETGNYYLRARYYSPEVGRFTQEDPIMDGLNWYTYCAGNPVRFYDPSGCKMLEPSFPWVLKGLTVGNWMRISENIRIYQNYKFNEKFSVSGIINGQGLSPVSDFRYGNVTLSWSGCEIIANYNALILLDNPQNLNDVANWGENHGQIANGVFGTWPDSSKKLFEHLGYTVVEERDSSRFDSVAADSDVCIFTFWNNKDNYFDAVHTVAIEQGKDGITVYNYYNEYEEPWYFDSFSDMISSENLGPWVLYGISK